MVSSIGGNYSPMGDENAKIRYQDFKSKVLSLAEQCMQLPKKSPEEIKKEIVDIEKKIKELERDPFTPPQFKQMLESLHHRLTELNSMPEIGQGAAADAIEGLVHALESIVKDVERMGYSLFMQ
jgi:hypothetical protein